MGLLDDAIREHLELKRRLGADSNEIERLEGEAFGPASRPGEPDFPEPSTGEEPLDEPPTALLSDSDSAVSAPPRTEDLEPGEPASAGFEEADALDAPAAPFDAADPESEVAEDPLGEPRPGLFDIESTAVELDEEAGPEPAPFDAADPLAGDALVEEPPADPEPTTISRLPEDELIASLGADPATEDPESGAAADELEAEESEADELEADAAESEPGEAAPGFESDPIEADLEAEAVEPIGPDPVEEPPSAIEEPPPTTISPTLAPVADPEPPIASEPEPLDDLDAEPEPAAPADTPFDADRAEDDFADIELDDDDQLEPPPAVDDPFATVEHPSARPAASPEPDGPQETTESPAADDEDVLEETPDFLRDQPEDDELWFEQGKPKDFDF